MTGTDRDAPPRPRRPRRRRAAFLIGSALVAAGAMLWWAMRVPGLHRRGAFPLPAGAAMLVGLSDDGRALLAAGPKKLVVLADAATGADRARLAAEDDIYVAAFRPDGRRFALGGWSWAPGKVTAPDGTALNFTSGDVTLRDAADGRRVATFAGSAYAFDGRFAADGRTFVALCSRQAGGTRLVVAAFDAETGRQRSRLDLPYPPPGFVPALSADGTLVAVVDPDGQVIRLKDLATGRDRRVLDAGGGPAVVGYFWLALAPDGRALAASRRDGTIHLYDLSAGRRPRVLAAGGNVLGLAFSRDSRLLAAHLRSDPAASSLPPALDALLSGPGRRRPADWLTLWDTSSGRRLGTAASTAPGRVPIQFPPDGRTLLDARADGPPAVYDLPEGPRGRE